MKKLAVDPENDTGYVWELPRVTKAHPVRPRLTLSCSYSGGPGTPVDKRTLPVPVTATSCVSRDDPYTNQPYGRCLKDPQ